MQRMLTTDTINLFAKPEAGASALALLPAGTAVQADDDTRDYNTKQGEFRFRRVTVGKMVGWLLDVYLEPDKSPATMAPGE